MEKQFNHTASTIKIVSLWFLLIGFNIFGMAVLGNLDFDGFMTQIIFAAFMIVIGIPTTYTLLRRNYRSDDYIRERRLQATRTLLSSLHPNDLASLRDELDADSEGVTLADLYDEYETKQKRG